MPAPKSRHTKSRRDRGRMHIYLPEKGLVACGHCGVKKLPHRVCKACGYYNKRQVLEVEEETGKTGKREKGKGPLPGLS